MGIFEVFFMNVFGHPLGPRTTFNPLCADLLATQPLCTGSSLSAGAVAGIAVTVTLLLTLTVGVVIGLGVAWYGMRRGQCHTSKGGQQTSQQLQENYYV